MWAASTSCITRRETGRMVSQRAMVCRQAWPTSALLILFHASLHQQPFHSNVRLPIILISLFISFPFPWCFSTFSLFHCIPAFIRSTGRVFPVMWYPFPMSSFTHPRSIHFICTLFVQPSSIHFLQVVPCIRMSSYNPAAADAITLRKWLCITVIE